MVARKASGLGFAAVLIILAVGASAAVFVPRWIADGDSWTAGPRAASAKDESSAANARLKAIADSRAAFLQFLVAVAGGATVYFTWKNYTRSSKEAESVQTLARESRTSENFIKAVEQLGSASPAVRAGGVFGLGRLLRRSTVDGDYWPIMDVLTTFVRDQAPRRLESPRDWKPSQDVQAALNVLARRSWPEIPPRLEDSPVDLHETDLKLAWLSGGNFQGAYLCNCRLVQVDLSCAKLDGADLTGADLTGADLTGADLTGADLTGADLTGADLTGAHLTGAHLTGAHLTYTNLSGADLAEAKVRCDQLAVAVGDEVTVLPAGVLRPASWS